MSSYPVFVETCNEGAKACGKFIAPNERLERESWGGGEVMGAPGPRQRVAQAIQGRGREGSGHAHMHKQACPSVDKPLTSTSMVKVRGVPKD